MNLFDFANNVNYMKETVKKIELPNRIRQESKLQKQKFSYK